MNEITQYPKSSFNYFITILVLLVILKMYQVYLICSRYFFLIKLIVATKVSQ